MTARKFDCSLPVWTVGILALLCPGVHILRGAMTARSARLLRGQAEGAQAGGDSARAASLWGRYLQLASDDLDGLVRYAELLEESSSNRASRRHVIGLWREVLIREPSHRGARRRLAMLLMESSANDEARKHFEFLTNALPEDGGLAVSYGRCLEALGEYEQAEVAYENAVRLSRHDYEAYERLADMLLRRQQSLKAVDVLDRLVEANPDVVRALLARGRFRLAQGAGEVARKDFDAALKRQPSDPEVLRACAIAAQAGRDLVAARRFWTELTQVRPEHPTGHLALASLDVEQGDGPEAVRNLERGLNDIPNDPLLLQFLAELELERGGRTRAEKLIAQLESEPRHRTRAAFVRALMLLWDHDLMQAGRVLEEVRSTRGVSAETACRASEQLGLIAQELGDVEGQMNAYARAVEANPASLSARIGYAASLIAAGKIEEGLKHFRYLVSLPGAPPAAQVGLCRALIRKNLLLPDAGRDWREVEQLLDRPARNNADKHMIAVLRAEVAGGRGQCGLAQSVLNEARGTGKMTLPWCEAQADLAYCCGDLSAARRCWHEMLKGEPSFLQTAMACVRFWECRAGRSAAAMFAELEAAARNLPEPERLRLLSMLAAAQYRLEWYNQAERLARQITERKPTDSAAWLLLFDLAVDTGRADLAAEVLPAIRRLDTTEKTWQLYGEAALACLRGDQASRVQARQALADLGGRRAGWPRVPLLEARLAAIEGDVKGTLDSLVQCMKLGDLRPSFVYRNCRALAEWGRFDEADDAITRLQLHAELGREFNRTAAEIALTGNPERAITLARKAAPMDSGDYRDQLWLGRLLARTGRRLAAEEAFRRAVALAEHSPDAWIALAGFLADADRMEDAEAVLSEALHRLPAETRLLAAAMGAEALHRWSRADACFQEALSATPDDTAVLRRAAQFYLRIDQPNRAEPLLRCLLDQSFVLSAEESAWARRQLTLLRNDVQEAGGLLDQEMDPLWPEAAANKRARALILAAQSTDHADALRFILEPATRAVMTADEQLRLARIVMAARDWPTARELMQDLLARDKTNPAYLAQFIDWLLERGGEDDARFWMTRLEKAASDDPRTVLLWEILKNRGVP